MPASESKSPNASPSPDTRKRRRDSPTKEAADDGRPAQRTRAEEHPKATNGASNTVTTRTGGVYIPPFKLAQMMREVDKSSPQYQRLTWDALRKSINGLINKVNAANIKHILPEIFGENLVRGRGLFCRSVMKSQMASPTFSPVYAALVAVINTKFPEIGDLLLNRIVLQFKRAFKRNDKPVCLAACTFIAHLVNQQVVHELLALEIIILLLEQPSDDSVEVAVGFTKEVGATLTDLAPQAVNTLFDRFRAVLTDGDIDTRTKYLIEGLFAVRKQRFPNNPAMPSELDLVETEDQITHEIGLEDDLQPQVALDVFKFDPDYEKHETEYATIKRELLGEDDEDDEEDDEDEDEDNEEEGGVAGGAGVSVPAGGAPIQDMTETNLINLRRTIYLTIMSSLDFEEAGHKLSKIVVPPGYEAEIPTMLIECCSQEKTFMRYYGLMAQRFCYINRNYQEIFEDCFVKQYQLIHRLETNKLRNVAKLFAHLLSTDAVSWAVLQAIRITEDDTTSSSRIFIKVLFQELSEVMGLSKLNERLQDPACAEWFINIFPCDTARNMRFSINFFTSIGLGGLTDDMRQKLKDLPRLLQQQQLAAAAAAPSSSDDSSSSDSSSSDSSSSDDSSSSSSSSDDEEPPPRHGKDDDAGRGALHSNGRGGSRHQGGDRDDRRDSRRDDRDDRRDSRRDDRVDRRDSRRDDRVDRRDSRRDDRVDRRDSRRDDRVDRRDSRRDDRVDRRDSRR